MDSLLALLNASSFGTIIFGLLSAATWGTGDFFGGLGARRSSVYGVIIVAHAVGLIFLTALALLWGESIPPTPDLLWGMAAGIAGAVGLTALYASLAGGQMGLNAPIIAVLAAVIPVTFSLYTEGMPGEFKFIGFGVALIAVWLLSRPSEHASGPPRGLGLALLAGLGLGGFFILINQGQSDAFLWPLVASRVASLPFMILVTLLMRQPLLPPRAVLPMAALTGTFDALGNLFFLLASNVGRLDVATVISSLYPVSTVILARIILKERVAALQVLGILLAMGAIVLIAL
jgi:drug/metabolite transporter (DMT)-like permease